MNPPDRRRVPAANPARRPGLPKVSPFQDAMAFCFRRNQEALNKEYRRRLADSLAEQTAAADPAATPECRQLFIHCDYNHQSRENLHRFGLRTGRVIAFGMDDNQQLGQPAHAMLEEGQKQSTYGALFVDIETKDDLKKRLVPAKIRQISAGALHSMALTDDGVPYTWGMGDQGILGRDLKEDENGDTDVSEATPTPVTRFTTADGVDESGKIAEILAGNTFSMYRSLAGNVYVNGYFRDDDNSTYKRTKTPYESPVGFNQYPIHVPLPDKVVRIYSGTDSEICVAELKNGRIMTWGMGQSGELARGNGLREPGPDGTMDLTKAWYLSVVNGEKVIDEAIIQKFMTPAFALFDYPTQKIKVLSAACGQLHMVLAGRPEGGQGESLVFTAGHNGNGQLGLDMFEKDLCVHRLTVVPKMKGKRIVKVAAGNYHSLVLDITGEYIYTWGSCGKGELGQGLSILGDAYRHEPLLVKFPQADWTALPTKNIFTDIKAGGAASMAITQAGEIFSWGFGENQATGHEVNEGQEVYWPRQLNLDESLGSLREGSSLEVMAVSVGSAHSMVLAKEMNSPKRKHSDT